MLDMMLDNLSLLDGLDPNDVAAAAAQHREERLALGPAAALQRQHRVQTRQVHNEEEMARLMPVALKPGESCHVLSTGDIDVLSFMRHLLTQQSHFLRVLCTTWRINRDDLEQIQAWLDSGQIERFDLLIDQRFARLAPDEYKLAQDISAEYGGTVTCCLNHSKVTLCAAPQDDAWLVIESSANVNTNRRLEQTAVHNCPVLFDFYQQAFDRVSRRSKSAAR